MAAESAKVAVRCEEAKSSCKLDLEKCDLRKFPDAIYLLMRGVALQSVSVAHNDLTIVPSKFGLKLVTITSLNLSFNQLTKLPMELENLTDLRLLDLSNNQFSSMPAVTVTFKKLQRLNMSYNQVQSIPQDFNYSNELNHLNLSHNLLKDMICLKSFPGLREVDVSHNQVQEVHWDGVDNVVGAVPWLETIDLRGNPLKQNDLVYLQSIVRLHILLSDQ